MDEENYHGWESSPHLFFSLLFLSNLAFSFHLMKLFCLIFPKLSKRGFLFSMLLGLDHVHDNIIFLIILDMVHQIKHTMHEIHQKNLIR
ncbi:hypothetical protein Lalb_Chr13g0292701 [Lupinus albus]|uniref:Uncharacterized protein n=1 Tax=Lupinus albus TaxID=3870 RepID=A0A6A4PHI8_LUPAL|nr:hypothetical protein Lalb_Chr13g0292701 [Lupinus albus]